MILAQGTHESTFLALEALESNIATGRTREERGKASQRNPSTCLARQNRSGRSDILHQILQWSNGVQRSVMTKRAIVVWRRILNYEGLLRKRKARRQKKQKKHFFWRPSNCIDHQIAKRLQLPMPILVLFHGLYRP